MAERKTNETLEQQRKARQEFLELKKMQNGEMDAGPKPSEVADIPKTSWEKFKNIWYHDKWYILGATALIVMLVFLITQCATHKKYDLKAVIFTYSLVAEEDNKSIEKYLEKYCADIDGNGEVNVQVINCSFSTENSDLQYQHTQTGKTQAIIASDTQALLFITDEDSFNYLNGISDKVDFFDGNALALGKDFYEECSGGEDDNFLLPEGLQISCRNIKDTNIKVDEKIEKYYEQSQAIIKGIAEEQK